MDIGVLPVLLSETITFQPNLFSVRVSFTIMAPLKAVILGGEPLCSAVPSAKMDNSTSRDFGFLNYEGAI